MRPSRGLLAVRASPDVDFRSTAAHPGGRVRVQVRVAEAFDAVTARFDGPPGTALTGSADEERSYQVVRACDPVVESGPGAMIYRSTKAAVVAVTPGILCLLLFYSLALHMYMSLGGWPKYGIGNEGFGPILVSHADLVLEVIGVTLLLSVYLWPVALFLSSLIPISRKYIPYVLLYAVTLVVCVGIALLAPDPFIYWWKD